MFKGLYQGQIKCARNTGEIQHNPKTLRFTDAYGERLKKGWSVAHAIQSKPVQTYLETRMLSIPIHDSGHKQGQPAREARDVSILADQ